MLRHPRRLNDPLCRTCCERAIRAASPRRAATTSPGKTPRCGCTTSRRKASPSPRRLILAEFRANLELALGKLPPRIAQVFQLYEVEERPNAEVCQRLHISVGNLWVMLHRARKQLREHPGDWGNGGAPPARQLNSINL